MPRLSPSPFRGSGDVVNLLPPYTGDGNPCKKCGYNLISTTLTSQQTHYGRLIMLGRYPMLPDGTEVLERECKRCGYTWGESPIEVTG